MHKTYDVVIAGGGLAGMTLALQLKLENKNISILVLEKRNNAAAIAAHKVGESTVELATHYFREVLDLKDYLDKHELPKHGLRFFFSDKKKTELSNRVELGPRLKLPVPSHQLDRGTFENYLEHHIRRKGVDVILGALVKDVEIHKGSFNTVFFEKEDTMNSISCKWIIDTTSRRSLLKRKFKFQQEVDHNVNSVWFRVKGVIDVDHWSHNEDWKKQLEPRLRYLSTVHLMDKGYWVWIIPLGTQNTSIGIVADGDLHPFDQFNTYEKAREWIKKHEPQAADKLCPDEEEILDFRILKHFAHGSQRMYSEDGWAVSGESGVFLDPFYSPGSDFIALSNTWITDIITRNLTGEDVGVRTQVFEKVMLSWFEAWFPIYQNKYRLFGNAQIMVLKIFWDWAVYWAIPCVLFTNHGFTDLRILKEMFVAEDSLGKKFSRLNQAVQNLFLEWLPMENRTFTKRYIDPLDLDYLRRFQTEIESKIHRRDMIPHLEDNYKILEHIAAEMFRLISHQVHNTPLDRPVNPYQLSLQTAMDNELHKDGLLPQEEIRKDILKMWFY